MDDSLPYPLRTKLFSMKFSRLLRTSRIASEIGVGGCWLLHLIADQEDVQHYTRAPSFWDSQLQEEMGGITQKTLSNIRAKCVSEGWLHYEHGRRGKAGRYFVMIPDWALRLLGANPAPEILQQSVNSPESIEGQQSVNFTDISNGPQLDADSSPNLGNNYREYATQPAHFLPVPVPVPDPDPIPLSSAQSNADSVTGSLPDRWAEVGGALKDVGVDHFGKAARTARKLGRTPEFCFELIEYFKKHQQRAGWKQGALCQRIMFAEDLPVDRGWPEMAKGSRAQSRKSSEDLDSWFDGMVEAKALQQLEMDFGAALNAITPAQLAELFAKAVATTDRTLVDLAKEAKRHLEFGTSLSDPKFRGPALKVLRRYADRKAATT